MLPATQYVFQASADTKPAYQSIVTKLALKFNTWNLISLYGQLVELQLERLRVIGRVAEWEAQIPLFKLPLRMHRCISFAETQAFLTLIPHYRGDSCSIVTGNNKVIEFEILLKE